MFKLFFKFVVITALFMCVAIYGNYLTTGKLPPYLQKKTDFSMPQLNEIGNKAEEMLNSINVSSNENYIYKWTDENGQIHLTSEPPDASTSFEAVKLESDVNIVPSVSPINNPVDDIQSSVPETNDTSNLNLKEVYSPEKVQQLYDDARSVRDQLNERASSQNQLLRE